MKPTRIVATLLLAFLFGGSSAEVAVQAKRAIERHRAVHEEGSAGELFALEIHQDGGELLARPRFIAVPGRPADVILRDPENPNEVRLALRVETAREPSGDLSVRYELRMPRLDLIHAGETSVTPGVEQRLDLGDTTVVATLLTLPVPSAAFDAYLEAERTSRVISSM
jgi:hypothetical protein